MAALLDVRSKRRRPQWLRLPRVLRISVSNRVGAPAWLSWVVFLILKKSVRPF